MTQNKPAAEEHKPIPDYIVGEGSDGNEYLVRITAPRFIARIAAEDEDGLPALEDADADLVSGLTFAGHGLTVCEIRFFDDDGSDQEQAKEQAKEQAIMEGCEFLAELKQEEM